MPSLSARSVVASTLLGTRPPRLPGRLLVAFSEEFGINPGTARVALSRMVDRGELGRLEDGVYELRGDLLDRHARQESGLTRSARRWRGEWEMWVVRSGGRDATDRAALRRAAGHLGLGELREGVWLRPDNLDPARLPRAREVVEAQADRFCAEPVDESRGASLVRELFDTEGWAAQTRALIAELAAASDTDALADGFELAARALRHLVSDPVLPDALAPPEWPAAALRGSYARYDTGFRARLAGFFRDQRRVAS